MKKIGVIFGGTSVEHEVSVITGMQVMENLDKSKYEAVPIYITKEGDTLSSVTKSLNANLEAIINQNRRIYLLPEQLIVYKKK